MANIPCCTPPVICDDPARPVGNFSSEAPDAEVFIGRFFGRNVEPRLGPNWRTTGCIGVCESTVSQQAADDCAQRQQVLCTATENPDEEPNPNPDLPPTTTPQSVYDNEQQSCSYTCADGQVYTYIVPAGTYSALSQAAANAIARSVACNRAVDTRICIGELAVASGCLGSDYEQTVSFTMLNPPAVVFLTSGSLPVGLTLEYDDSSFTLTGTLAGEGTYAFTVQVEDVDGRFMTKEFTIGVATIANTALASGTVGNAYSETLFTTGPITGAATWSVSSGSLPAGLTLNPSTGVISGTPTTQGTSTFTITMTDEG